MRSPYKKKVYPEKNGGVILIHKKVLTYPPVSSAPKARSHTAPSSARPSLTPLYGYKDNGLIMSY